MRRLHLDVEMARASLISSRNDGAKGVSSFGVGKDVAAQTKPLVVVFPAVVRVPKIDKGAGDRLARPREHKAGQLARAAAQAWLSQIAALRRARCIKGAFGLPWRQSSPSLQAGVGG